MQSLDKPPLLLKLSLWYVVVVMSAYYYLHFNPPPFLNGHGLVIELSYYDIS